MPVAKSKNNINNEDEKPVKVYVLSGYEKELVEAGLADVEQGKIYSSNEANKLMSAWLKK